MKELTHSSPDPCYLITVRNIFKNVVKDFNTFPVSIYLIKVSNGITRTIYKICLKLAINESERLHGLRSGVFIINFKQISDMVLLFPSLT